VYQLDKKKTLQYQDARCNCEKKERKKFLNIFQNMIRRENEKEYYYKLDKSDSQCICWTKSIP